MNELVYLKNDEAVCSSLLVAEKFEKRHADVMRAIDNLVENDSTQNCVQCFKRGTYKDSTGKSNKMYVMNRDGFTFLVMGYLQFNDSQKKEFLPMPRSMGMTFFDSINKVLRMRKKVLRT